MKALGRKQLNGLTLKCSTSYISISALAIKGLVGWQLKMVTWNFSNIYMRKVVHGMKTLVIKQLEEDTWMC